MSRFRLLRAFPPRIRIVGAFRRSESGATAVEFAIVALPFLLITFAILEIAMLFWTNQVLETAVANASRQVYTGQFQTSAANQTKTTAQMAAAFKTSLCSYVVALFDCMSVVSVDIRNASSFAGATPPSPVNNGVFDASSFTYQTIPPNQIGLVTAAMEYKWFTKILAGGTSLTNGNRLLIATATFRAEPYSN